MPYAHLCSLSLRTLSCEMSASVILEGIVASGNYHSSLVDLKHVLLTLLTCSSLQIISLKKIVEQISVSLSVVF